jgi:uncharacterized protein YbjT (DUF2867 family)
MTHDQPILITGAAGQVGAVGRSVTQMLRANGFRVRALVRTDDDRAAGLREMGAEVVVGDLLDLHAMHRALEGCRRVYFGMSITATYMEAAVNLAAVARHHLVDAFVNISQMTVAEMTIHETTPSPQQKQHWLAEQVFAWSGLPVVEVRPTIFLDGFFLRLAARSVCARDQLVLPFGNGKTNAIAAFDVARVIATILADPHKHIGGIYHLTGPASQNLTDIARDYSRALGRPIVYVDAPLDVWKARLQADGVPAHLLSHLATMAMLHQQGRYDRLTNDVERLTGKAPLDVEQFVRRNAGAFAATLANAG